MLANHQLAKATSDLGFYELRKHLNYKCQVHSSKLVIIDRWFPSPKTCSNCGIKKNLSLSARVFNCDSCGFECDRDFNPAINLSQCSLGISLNGETGVLKAVS
ncbi:zinc ribbon domain-containing protein [Umezakia ovalisporum]|jgi:putative transposase|uniref:Transposase n=2 Tax=Umezakia ovalisporum TaxID=75695 RepID=A0AA43GYP5_9CYAN|nr:zinc ribbon domain-containing protein [Umezakia ovalisporum]MBI1240644.1 transposase [Nostoc sp. RI_552]MDH6058324.1 transposase [Umezakia ovalisporum FSS-43]MDH6063916.1 transposase [Umezakia ovalisporum FSS-62]MDH6067344.1 transposase [Umezakia ovalisporum APH033B]MDH6071471.1 transposase [Umezakia ovalisporum CobakiLakeA]